MTRFPSTLAQAVAGGVALGIVLGVGAIAVIEWWTR